MGRVAKATKQVLGTLPPVGRRTRRVFPPGTKTLPFLVVETPYYTFTHTGIRDVVYGVQMPQTGLPLKLNMSLQPLPHVTERGGDGEPSRAFLQSQSDAADGEFDCVAINIGDMQGRPLRGQIVFATYMDGGWRSAGTVNPTLFATAIGETGAKAEIKTTGFEDDENATLTLGNPAIMIPSIDIVEGQLVVLTWIGHTRPENDDTDFISQGGGDYYITYARCQDTEE